MQNGFQEKLSAFLSKPADSSLEELSKEAFSESEAKTVLEDIAEYGYLDHAERFLSALQIELGSETSRLIELHCIIKLQDLISHRIEVLNEKANIQSQSHSESNVQPEVQSKEKTEVQSQFQDQTEFHSQSQDIVESQLLPQDNDPTFPYYIDNYNAIRDSIKQCLIVIGFFSVVVVSVALAITFVRKKLN